MMGHVHIVRRLLQAKANINYQNKVNYTINAVTSQNLVTL